MLSLLRRNRAFRTLFAAQVVSFCGDWFATVALLGLVDELTNGSALALSLVFVAQFLPAFFMSVVAGPVADRFDRRRVMIVVSCLQSVAAIGFIAAGPGRVWMAFAAQALITMLGAFFAPASQAALPNLVAPEDLPTAVSALGATWGAMLAIGASLGAIFTTLFGRDAAFVADGLSFLGAAALLATIRVPMSAASSSARRQRLRPIADTSEALKVARNDPQLLALLCSKAGFGLSSGVVGMLAVLATTSFGAGDGGTGVLLAARGVGVVVGPLLAGRVARGSVPHILRLCALSSITYGLMYGLVSLAPSLAIAAVLVLVAHLGGGAQWTLSTYGLQMRAPDAVLGRIMAADFAIVTLTMSISFVVAGALESVIGADGVLVVLGATACLWGVVYLRITSRLRGSTPLATQA